ncbi:MAG TPA: hypothetical protein V6D12_21145 [Candidatus Obscuribacterales bacterium]
MKLSVLNSNPRQGRLSSLIPSDEAHKNFYYDKFQLLREAAERFSCEMSSCIPRQPLKHMNQVYTIRQGGK